MVGPAARHPPGAALSDPVFRREGDAFIPTGHARGPWDPGAQHGGAPAALVAEAVAALEPDMLVARLTYEFLGPVPLAPLTMDAEIIRPGRRFQVVEAELRAGGEPVLRARAMRLRRGDVALPDGVAENDARPGGRPEDALRRPFPLDEGHAEGFHRTAMDIRFAAGTDYGRGPALAWFRLARPLVDDRAASAPARVAAAADFGNGVSRILDFEDWLFVNTDLTIHLDREPAGEWVLLDARTRVEPHGVGLAVSTLYDERGPIGMAAQSLFVEAR